MRATNLFKGRWAAATCWKHVPLRLGAKGITFPEVFIHYIRNFLDAFLRIAASWLPSCLKLDSKSSAVRDASNAVLPTGAEALDFHSYLPEPESNVIWFVRLTFEILLRLGMHTNVGWRSFPLITCSWSVWIRRTTVCLFFWLCIRIQAVFVL